MLLLCNFIKTVWMYNFLKIISLHMNVTNRPTSFKKPNEQMSSRKIEFQWNYLPGYCEFSSFQFSAVRLECQLV